MKDIDYRVIISNNTDHLKGFLINLGDTSREEGAYIYLGSNRDNSLTELLEEKGFIEYKKRYYDSTYKDRFFRNYIDLIGKIGQRYNSVYWWATITASKNRFTTTIVPLLHQLEIIEDLVENMLYKKLIIINPPEAITQAMKKLLKNKGIEWMAFETKRSVLHGYVISNLRFLAREFLFALRMGYKRYYSRKILGKIFESKIDKGIPYYVIKTFIYDRSFNNKGDYNDSFFGVLPENIGRRKDLIIIANILGDYRECTRKIKENKDFVIIPIEFLLSYHEIVLTIIKVLLNRVKLKEEAVFFTKDVSDIVNAELSLYYEDTWILFEFLHYYATKNLARRVSVDTFLLTFENNPWEKMCIMALRKYSPESKIIGYQHNAIPLAAANMFISKFEKEIIPIPDRIITVGDAPKRIMEQYGSVKERQVVSGCALRYSYLFELQQHSERTYFKQILLVLEGIYEVYHMVNYILKELKDFPEYNVKIRTHPVLPLENIRDKISNDIDLYPHFSISKNTSLEKDILESDIVMYWGSTVALEALFMGKPLINFDNGSLFSYDPLFECNSFKWVVDKDDSLIRVIQDIYTLEDSEFVRLSEKAQKYLLEYFHRISDERLNQFVV